MDYSQILQLQLRPNIIDLGWGHPDMKLLPHAQIQSATNVALHRWGCQEGHASSAVDLSTIKPHRQEGKSFQNSFKSNGAAGLLARKVPDAQLP
jgi:hypothetical protein